MIITVKRAYQKNATFGVINNEDGSLICKSLEDRNPLDGEPRIKGQCCIPEGLYQVQPRFEGTVFRWMKDKVPDVAKYGIPHIFNIPGETYNKWIDDYGVRKNQYVLIHIGNRITDTEGCLLTGTEYAGDEVMGSTIAFKKMYDIIKIPMSKGELKIKYEEA